MTYANPTATPAKRLRGLILAGVAGAAVYMPAKAFFDQDLLPLSINLPPLEGKDDVDPRTAIAVEAAGPGVRLAKVELRDDSGKLVAEGGGATRVAFSQPLAFGTRYTLRATAERAWPEQSETREISFATVAMPRLEGPNLLMLGPDGAVSLRFDRPVGEVKAKSELNLAVAADDSHQTIKLAASDYQPDRTYPVELELQTASGVPLPPVTLEVATAPPLSADTNLKGQGNLGLAIPLQVKFSEPLADRAGASEKLHVQTAGGQAVAGRWSWVGPKQLQFTPQPGWPASSDIEVSADPQSGLKSVRGGILGKPLATRFSTGPDRHLYVYLDAQRVDAVENGQVVRSFKVSTGKPKTPTVTGNFYIYDRYTHKTMRSDVPKGQKGWYEVENVPYTQFFHKDYAFHGAFWHNSFGRPASHGCVNMSTKDHNTRWPGAPEDAGWLYRWAALGVPVTVTKGAPALAARPAGEGLPAADKSAGAGGETRQMLVAEAAGQQAKAKNQPKAPEAAPAREDNGAQDAPLLP